MKKWLIGLCGGLLLVIAGAAGKRLCRRALARLATAAVCAAALRTLG